MSISFNPAKRDGLANDSSKIPSAGYSPNDGRAMEEEEGETLEIRVDRLVRCSRFRFLLLLTVPRHSRLSNSIGRLFTERRKGYGEEGEMREIRVDRLVLLAIRFLLLHSRLSNSIERLFTTRRKGYGREEGIDSVRPPGDIGTSSQLARWLGGPVPGGPGGAS
jgi:hypothetical protein